VVPRCAYSDCIFFEGDHSAGSMFLRLSSSSSRLHRRDGVCDSICSNLDVLATRFDGDKSKRVGGCTHMVLVIALTGLSCGMGNSVRVDVAQLGFICCSVTKFGLKGMIPITLKAA
jgi:hypothetical protein